MLGLRCQGIDIYCILPLSQYTYTVLKRIEAPHSSCEGSAFSKDTNDYDLHLQYHHESDDPADDDEDDHCHHQNCHHLHNQIVTLMGIPCHHNHPL